MTKSAFTAEVTIDGRITLPAALCERLGLRAGDHVTLMADGADIHVEKADNGASEGAAQKSTFDKWYGYLSHEEKTSDEIFEELRGRKIGELP